MGSPGESSGSLEDQALVADLRLRRPEAVERLASAYGAFLFNVALRITGSASDAEDVVQETLLRAWTALPPSGPVRLRPWLATVTTRLALNELRRRRRHPASPLPTTAPAAGGEARGAGEDALADTAPLADPYRATAAALSERDALAALARLPDTLRAAMVLRALHGLDYAEIGSILGCSAGAARVKVHRARQHCSRTLLAPLADVPEEPGCRRVRERIDAWAAGELSGEEADEVREHLASCELCQQVHERADLIRSAWALVPLLGASVRPSPRFTQLRPPLPERSPGAPPERAPAWRSDGRARRAWRSLKLRRALLGESARHGATAILAVALLGAGTYGVVTLATDGGHHGVAPRATRVVARTRRPPAPTPPPARPAGGTGPGARRPVPPVSAWRYTATARASTVPALVVGRTYGLILLDNLTMEDIATGPVGTARLHVRAGPSPYRCLNGAVLNVFRLDGRLFLHDGDQGPMCTYGTFELAPASVVSPAEAPVITATMPSPVPSGAVLTLAGRLLGTSGVVQLVGHGAAGSGPVYLPAPVAYGPDRARVRLAAGLPAGRYDVLVVTGAGAAATTLVRVLPAPAWQQEPAPTTATLNAVSCVSWATPAGTTTTSCYAVGNSGTILFSSNAGRSFVRQAAPTTADLRGISCRHLAGPGLRVPLACWAVGDRGTILLDRNGLGWRLATTSPATARPFEAVACQADGLRCWAVGEAVAAALDSALPGTGWHPVTILGPAGSECGPGGPQNACLNGVALAGDEPLAVGGGGNVYAQSGLQGSSWSNQISLGAGYFTSIACDPGSPAGRSTCIAVGTDPSLSRDRIERTTDSGTSWLPAVSPLEGTLPALRAVAVVPGAAHEAVAVGDAGTIVTSLDDGATWARQPSPTTASLRAVACPSTVGPTRGHLVCLAVGQEGSIVALR